jgi:hypothetical protein
VVDAGLALALAVANTIGIRAAPAPGARPDAVAYACGLTIAALALARRRWPLAVLLASAATLQLYVANYTSTYRAVPLSVALATAAGRCWSPPGTSSGRSPTPSPLSSSSRWSQSGR